MWQHCPVLLRGSAPRGSGELCSQGVEQRRWPSLQSLRQEGQSSHGEAASLRAVAESGATAMLSCCSETQPAAFYWSSLYSHV